MAKHTTFSIQNIANFQNALFTRINLFDEDKKNFKIEDGYEAIILKNGSLEKTLKTGVYMAKNFLKNAKTLELLIYQKTIKNTMLWGTKDQFTFFDSTLEEELKLGANGLVEIQISNIRKFYLQFGNKFSVFEVKDLKNLVLLNFLNFMQAEISWVMQKEKYSFLNFEKEKNNVANAIKHKLSLKMEEVYGVKISQLVISGVLIPNKDINNLKQKNKHLTLTADFVEDKSSVTQASFNQENNTDESAKNDNEKNLKLIENTETKTTNQQIVNNQTNLYEAELIADEQQHLEEEGLLLY